MWRKLLPEDLDESAFRLIGEEKLLVTSGLPGEENAMTASWGAFGVFCHRPSVLLFLRPERWTHRLIRETGAFSVTVLPPGSGAVYALCGSRTGRDGGKLRAAQLTPFQLDGIPALREGRLAALCRLTYLSPLQGGGFCSEGDREAILKKGALHHLVIGEIVHLLKKE